MLLFGVNADSETRSEISKLDNKLTSDYVIMEEGKEPALGTSLGMLVLGVVLLIAQVLLYAGRLQRKPA